MSDNVDRAAEVIAREYGPCNDDTNHDGRQARWAAEALNEAGLLIPGGWTYGAVAEVTAAADAFYDRAAMTVWPFWLAPAEYRDLSPHGGDEDWVVWLSDGATEGDGQHALDLVERLTICSSSMHKVDDGTVWITCHA